LTCLLGRNQSFQDTPPNLFVNFLSYTTFDHNSGLHRDDSQAFRVAFSE
jgi:hypothetical protein